MSVALCAVMPSRPLHVLVTADAVGGVWTYVQTLADALAPRGVRFTVAVTGPEPTVAQRRRLLAHPYLGLAHRPFRLEWMPDAAGDVARAGDWLLGLAARVRPDVVHVNGYAHAALPFEVPVIVVAHSCVCSWWRAVHGGEAPDAWRAYRVHVAAGLRAAAALVAPTRALADMLACEHGGHAARTVIIPNGIAPRRRPLAVKAPIVLAAGRLWDEAKGLAVLDRAAADLAWPVHAAGALRRPDGVVEAPCAMRPLGPLDPDALAAWMDRAAIFAHPARYEPFGLAPLEAARAGCALVLGDLPSLREVWGDAAVYVDPASATAVRDGIASLIDDPDRRRRLARAAAARAASYTAERMGRAYEALYRRLACPAAAVLLAGASTCA
jgi:glycosyltransferase involved in cell wall biosynthesis